jgi:hypothetical protein
MTHFGNNKNGTQCMELLAGPREYKSQIALHEFSAEPSEKHRRKSGV